MRPFFLQLFINETNLPFLLQVMAICFTNPGRNFSASSETAFPSRLLPDRAKDTSINGTRGKDDCGSIKISVDGMAFTQVNTFLSAG